MQYIPATCSQCSALTIISGDRRRHQDVRNHGPTTNALLPHSKRVEWRAVVGELRSSLIPKPTHYQPAPPHTLGRVELTIVNANQTAEQQPFPVQWYIVNMPWESDWFPRHRCQCWFQKVSLRDGGGVRAMPTVHGWLGTRGLWWQNLFSIAPANLVTRIGWKTDNLGFWFFLMQEQVKIDNPVQLQYYTHGITRLRKCS